VYACSDLKLAKACLAKINNENNLSGLDPSIFEPVPKNILEVLQIKDSKVRRAWLHAYRQELKVLIVTSNSFSIEDLSEGEKAIPVLETNKIKYKSDGSLDKLKVRIVVRGDLQDNTTSEDKWSPTASFRGLKMFLAHACRLKVRVRQLDFIGAYLQARCKSRIFIKFPASLSQAFPEFNKYFGRPLRLLKSMYGMTLSGKYWYQELQEYLLGQGFVQSTTIPCLFYKIYEDGSVIFLLNYVDDLLYYGTRITTIKIFEDHLLQRFDLQLMGQSHWYLSTRITQTTDYDIIIDQTRYCKSVLKRYLDSVGHPNNIQPHNTPLPLEFSPTTQDSSATLEDAHQLSTEFNLDYASCIGSLIYLSVTCVDILHAVNKLAKFMQRLGRNHFIALIHVL
jgi:hypothetical protein